MEFLSTYKKSSLSPRARQDIAGFIELECYLAQLSYSLNRFIADDWFCCCYYWRIFLHKFVFYVYLAFISVRTVNGPEKKMLR